MLNRTIGRPQLGLARRTSAASARLRSARPARSPAHRTPRHPARLVVASATPADDPYSVLGVTPLSDSDRVRSAYNRKLKSLANDGASEEELAAVEAAYNSILMKQLTMRKQGTTFGGMKVSNELRFADQLSWIQQYCPWRPRRADCDKQMLLANGGILGVLCAFTLYQVLVKKLTIQPMTFGMIAFFVAIFMKLQKLFPDAAPSYDEEEPREKKVDSSKFMRALGLVLGSTLLTISIFVGIPMLIVDGFRMAIPAILITQQATIINLSVNLVLFTISAFYC